MGESDGCYDKKVREASGRKPAPAYGLAGSQSAETMAAYGNIDILVCVNIIGKLFYLLKKNYFIFLIKSINLRNNLINLRHIRHINSFGR
jgi:hypothetical protein